MNMKALMPVIGVQAIITSLCNSSYATTTETTTAGTYTKLVTDYIVKNTTLYGKLVGNDTNIETTIMKVAKGILTDEEQIKKGIVEDIMNESYQKQRNKLMAYLELLTGRTIGGYTVPAYDSKNYNKQLEDLKKAIEKDSDLSKYAYQEDEVTIEQFTTIPEAIKSITRTNKTKVKIKYKNKEQKPQISAGKITANNEDWKYDINPKIAPEEMEELFIDQKLKFSLNDTLTNKAKELIKQYYTANPYDRDKQITDMQTDIDAVKTTDDTDLAKAFIETLAERATKDEEGLKTKLKANEINPDKTKTTLEIMKDAETKYKLDLSAYIGYPENGDTTKWISERKTTLGIKSLTNYRSDDTAEQINQLLSEAKGIDLYKYITQLEQKRDALNNEKSTLTSANNRLQSELKTKLAEIAKITNEKTTADTEKSKLETQVRDQALSTKKLEQDVKRLTRENEGYKIDADNIADIGQEIKDKIGSEHTDIVDILGDLLNHLEKTKKAPLSNTNAKEISDLRLQITQKDSEIKRLNQEITDLTTKGINTETRTPTEAEQKALKQARVEKKHNSAFLEGMTRALTILHINENP